MNTLQPRLRHAAAAMLQLAGIEMLYCVCHRHILPPPYTNVVALYQLFLQRSGLQGALHHLCILSSESVKAVASLI